MAIFLDSADLNHARQAAALGFVEGATTNPTLLARAGHVDYQEAMREMCSILAGTVFYQLVSHGLNDMRLEAETFRAIAPNLGLKILCSTEGLRLASEVSRDSPVAITGVFDPSQAYLASIAGARFVIPYVNRLTRYIGNGPAVVQSMAEVIGGTECEILAASIRSPSEAMAALRAGAHHLSVPLDVLRSMAENPLSDQARLEFDAS
jgi:transaldolase